MSGTIDSGQEEGVSAQSKPFQSIKPMVTGKPNQIQLTFNDFKNVTMTKSPEDMLKHANDMLEQSKRRRSRRVVPKRPLDDDEEEPPKRQIKKKRKPVSKKAKESNIDREAVKERVKKQQQSAIQQTTEPLLTEESWSPNVPLKSSAFKSHHSVVSRLKSPNMKTVPYANDVIRVMSFINKFNQFFPRELWGLSFQDFEVGLDLYPEIEKGSTQPLYQDFLLIRDVVRSQDKMNLLFLSLLKLALNNNSATSMEALRNTSRPYAKFIDQLRAHAWSWGYPREWRKDPSSTMSKEDCKYFAEDDNDPVDISHPEILTPNIYVWPQQSPIDQDPLATSELEKNGILALQPRDRSILLRILTQWCLAQSEKIHSEIFRLSHLKRDPPFGVSTSHVPLLMAEGELVMRAKFKRLCELLATKLKLKSKKKHVKKQLETGKREGLSNKLKVLEAIQQDMKKRVRERELNESPAVSEWDESIDKDFDEWCDLIKGEVPDHPLQSPFGDEIYKLRSSEFFIGRVPHVGDFYLPRLFTYQNQKGMKIPSTYTDFRSLKQLFASFASNEVDAFTLFGKNGKLMSVQFKLLYHDTPSMIRDVASQADTKSKTYWYEMCHNCETLQEFITLLDYKLGLIEITDGDSTNKSAINKNPLPKESKYNASREKIRILKNYLTQLYYFLEKFEELGVKYGDMQANDRTLRRSQRNKVNYADDDGAYQDEGDEYLPEEQTENSEDNYQDDDDQNPDDDTNSDDSDEEARFQQRRLKPSTTRVKKRGRGRPRKNI